MFRKNIFLEKIATFHIYVVSLYIIRDIIIEWRKKKKQRREREW